MHGGSSPLAGVFVRAVDVHFPLGAAAAGLVYGDVPRGGLPSGGAVVCPIHRSHRRVPMHPLGSPAPLDRRHDPSVCANPCLCHVSSVLNGAANVNGAARQIDRRSSSARTRTAPQPRHHPEPRPEKQREQRLKLCAHVGAAIDRVNGRHELAHAHRQSPTTVRRRSAIFPACR